jgi:hypothetical protein
MSAVGLRVVLVAVLLVLIGLALIAPSQRAADREVGIAGVRTYSDLSRDHVSPPIEYEQTPPVGGPHVEEWLACDGQVYDAPVADESAVHSLEHGAVWITYSDSLSAGEVDSLVDRVAGGDYRLLSPYPDQDAPVTLTAWGLQLSVESVDDPRIDEFLVAFSNGPQTPEPGATCAAPTGGMDESV